MERSCVTTGIVIHLELAYSAFSSTYKAYGATYTATYSADAEAYMIQGLRRILRARLLGLEEQLLLNSFSLKENSIGGNECERTMAYGSFSGVLLCDQVSMWGYLRQGLIPSRSRKLPPMNAPVLVSQLYTLALQNWSGTATMLKEAIRYEKSPRLLSREVTQAKNQLEEYGVSILRGYLGKK